MSYSGTGGRVSSTILDATCLVCKEHTMSVVEWVFIGYPTKDPKRYAAKCPSENCGKASYLDSLLKQAKLPVGCSRELKDEVEMSDGESSDSGASSEDDVKGANSGMSRLALVPSKSLHNMKARPVKRERTST